MRALLLLFSYLYKKNMSRKALEIEISPRVKSLFEKELNRYQLESHFALRMQIVYYSEQGKTNRDIAKMLGCLEKTVRKWRKRWHYSHDALKAFEQGHDKTQVTDKKLMGKAKEILSDMPRAGAPCRITDIEKARLQTLACEHPERYGLPFSGWTHIELSKQANKMGIVVSPAHCGRILKKRGTPP